ncbi:aspartate aminotransferase family protein [Capillimicrobium parvum]|nr:aminotransferase class III-fold pyridoxal phosphate-dependent enzyme [Capillimicrobium parvum]
MVGPGAPYAIRGEGCRLWDDTGRVVIDCNNNFASLIHGHAHPAIVAAAFRAIEDGSAFGLPNERELDHAETLLERLPNADAVRYVNSGTEAVMTALRIARAHTGRSRCILTDRAYHGFSDIALATGDERSRRGLPPGVMRDTILLGHNDTAALIDTIERKGADVAAVLIDLMPNRPGLLPAEPEHVRTLVQLCHAHGIVIVVDEVISFRLGPTGRSPLYGLEPDLVILGKLIGGGFPVGAVAGRGEIMHELDPRRATGLDHGGTFSGNPVTMAAGLAALDLFDDAEIRRLNELGDRVRGSLEAPLAAAGWEVRGSGSLLRPWPVAPGDDRATIYRALWWAAYRRGLLLNPTGLVALSTPMEQAVADEIVDVISSAVDDVATGWRPPADGGRVEPAGRSSRAR